MSNRKTIASLLLAAAAVTGIAIAQDTTPATTPAVDPIHKPKEVIRDAEEVAKKKAEYAKQEAEKAAKQAEAQAGNAADVNDPMAQWAKANMPTKEHAQLIADMLGEWTVENEVVFAPGAPAEKSTGTAKCEPIFGGRFVKMDYDGVMMGQPFKGFSLWGYNTPAGKFESTWIDNSSVGMMYSTGVKQADGSVEWTGTWTDPITKESKTSRSVTRMADKNTMVYEAYDKTTDGTEFKMMTVTYTRVKGMGAENTK
ncbi:MAG TPA: DUF1579 domain-containing protein [Phycisphaerales bacterium]|nr:DUF1579 domain-containing protein [Phycisphaerales bacterium]